MKRVIHQSPDRAWCAWGPIWRNLDRVSIEYLSWLLVCFSHSTFSPFVFNLFCSFFSFFLKTSDQSGYFTDLTATVVWLLLMTLTVMFTVLSQALFRSAKVTVATRKTKHGWNSLPSFPLSFQPIKQVCRVFVYMLNQIVWEYQKCYTTVMSLIIFLSSTWKLLGILLHHLWVC